jgi:hypothetical protein
MVSEGPNPYSGRQRHARSQMIVIASLVLCGLALLASLTDG